MNKLFTKDHVEEIANKRYEICKQCKHHGKECIVPGTGPCCALCGCCLELKTRSLSSDCPEGKWEAVLTEEEEDLLNEQL
ncbi:MAG: hypothetical protein EOL97_13730 [Spirochaetia bacterium]|nr:hypothetical protein [Spirochaetia bacterium]